MSGTAISNLPAASDADVPKIILPGVVVENGAGANRRVTIPQLASQVGAEVIAQANAVADVVGRGDLFWQNYGCVGDGKTDNKEAWARFIADIVRTGKRGIIPPGIFYISDAPGVIPGSESSQVDVPAIVTPGNIIRLVGSGSNMTTLLAKKGERDGLGGGPVSWPLLRIIGGPGLEMAGICLDGGFRSIPSPAAQTLTSPTGDEKARAVCTLIETDGTAEVTLTDVAMIGFYGTRDNTSGGGWAFRSRRTGPICIHRADYVQVRDMQLLHPTYREGPYFANCARVDIDGFRYKGDYAQGVLDGGHALSTPLNIFGPEQREANVRRFYAWNHGGSALNGGGAGPFTLDGFHVGADVVGGSRGDGLDFGIEHQAMDGHPALSRLVVTNGKFTRCSRYSLRSYLSTDNPSDVVIFSNLTMEDCYQGPEISASRNVSLANITVLRPFWRSDYSASGRGCYLANIANLSWNNMVIDGRGGEDTARLNIGIYLRSVQNVVAGTTIIYEAYNCHFLLYNNSSDPDGLNSKLHIGDVHCFQEGERNPDSIFSAIHLGRGNHRIADLSVGTLNYNGLPALLNPRLFAIFSTDRVPGVQDIYLGDPNDQATAWQNVLARINFVNGDRSGTQSAQTRARIEAKTGRSNGRGAAITIQTSTVDEPPTDSFTITEHGSVIFHSTASREAPVSRRDGEEWWDGTDKKICTVSGTIYTTPLSGVTATADGSNVITVSSAAGIANTMYLLIGATKRRVLNVVGTTLTLDGTVEAGTELEVAYADPTIKTVGMS